MSTPGTFTSGVTRELNFELLIMRVACALPFIFHGPAPVGYLVGLAQFAGGLAILLGALLRVGAICVMIVMVGAIFLVHLPHGYDIGHGGLEYALTEFLLSAGLLFAGPGKYSLASLLPAPLRKL